MMGVRSGVNHNGQTVEDIGPLICLNDPMSAASGCNIGQLLLINQVHKYNHLLPL